MEARYKLDNKEMEIIIKLSESVASLTESTKSLAERVTVLNDRVDKLSAKLDDLQDDINDTRQVAKDALNSGSESSDKIEQFWENIRNVVWYFAIPFILYLIGRYWK